MNDKLILSDSKRKNELQNGQTKLDLLNSFSGLKFKQKLKESNLSKSFFEEQDKLIFKIQKEREKEYNKLKMSYTKFIKPFDL